MNAQRAINTRYLIFDVASLVSYGEKTDFLRALPFILGYTHHAHAHGALLLVEFHESNI